MSKFIVSLFLFATAFGNGVNNGGDELRNLVRDAKALQARRILGLSSCSLIPLVKKEVADWIFKNKKDLAEDIVATEHQWTLEKQPTCALTTRVRNAEVQFSFPTCEKTTSNREAISRIVVHESVHHFGIDDENFADAVAYAVVSARLVPGCPGDKNVHVISSANWQTCELKGAKVDCEDKAMQPLPNFPKPLKNPRDLAVGSGFLCAVDDTGVNCLGSNLITENIPRPIGSVLGIYAGERTACQVDGGGLACWGGVDGRFAEFSDIRHVAVAPMKICVLGEREVSCIALRSEFEPVTGLVNPRALARGPFGDSLMCALDDSGVACWSADNKVDLNFTEFSWPEQLTMGSSWMCVLDNRDLKCWRRLDGKIRTMLQALPEDTKISLELRKVCVSAASMERMCIKLGL